MNFPKTFIELSEQEKMLVCFMAHAGRDLDLSTLMTHTTRLKMMRGHALAALEKLTKCGFISEIKRYYYGSISYTIKMKYICHALFYIYMEHPEWEEMFGVVAANGEHKKLCNSMREMVKNTILREHQKAHGMPVDELYIPKSPGTYDIRIEYFDAIAGILLEPEMTDLLCALDSSYLARLLENASICEMEQGHGRVVEMLRRIVEKRPDFIALHNHSIASVCQDAFYVSGEWLFDEFKVLNSDYYLLACKAVQLAYKGEYSNAAKMMAACLKARNAIVNASDKNIFGDYITNYFLMLIYALEGSDGSRKKMEMATRKNIMQQDDNAAAQTLAYYFSSYNKSIKTTPIAYLMFHEKNLDSAYNGSKELGYHVARYLDMKDSDLKVGKKIPSMDVNSYQSKLAIIRHEMSEYLPMSAEEKERLEKCFGGKPLLTSIYRKQEWELVLEEIYKNESKGVVSEGSVSSRGIYIMNTHDEDVEVREQKLLKNGTWGKGKKVSTTGYAAGNFAMDDTDRKIYESNRQKGRSNSMPNLTVVIPLLAGTDDRLYMESSYNNYDPITIVQEKPFLTLKKDNDGIHLNTNIPGRVNYSRTVIWNFDRKTMRLTYYPMDAKERQYLRQLTSLGTLPLKAEAMLQQVFPTLKGKVEIHTDFIEGVEQLQEEDGQTMVCLRVIPRSMSFDVTIHVIPLKGGHQSFVPGEGKDIIFDERDGERFQVKRHKRLEKRNAQVFYDFMEEELDILDVDDEDNPRGTLTLNAEEMIALMDFAHEHGENGYIEWPEGEKLRLKMAQPQTWSVSMQSRNGWFDVEGEVAVDEDTVLSIGQLLELVSSSRSRFVQLGEGEYLSITESLRKQLMKISSLASVSRGKTRIPAVGVALMGSAFEGELEIKHTKAVDDLRKKIKTSGKLRPSVPEELNATLRDYQFDGYQWMSRLDSWGAGACLADDMGLGKTIQSIAFILSKRDDGAALVVAPASVVPNWRNEIKRFAPTLNIVVLNEQGDRQKAIEEADSGTVLITTYGLLITQEEALTEKMWGVICLDEAHTIKNRDTKMSGVCMKLQSLHRIILTGTPLQNHLGELWNLFQFVNPGLLGTFEQFQKKFIMPIEASGDEERRQLLRRIIKPFMLRRTKQEVATELPDKEEITLHVEMSKEEMAVYEVIRRRAKEELEELQRQGKKVNISTLAEITKLRMASCSAQLAEKSWTGSCSKLNTFVDLVSELKQNGHRALVFSQFTSFLDMAKKHIDESKELKGLRYFYLDGGTPMKKREEMVKAFQKGECDLFIISLKAGGLGLNLTGANYVIHLDPWWNPAIEQQATDRAHRIGQTEKVTVYHLISGNTIEEKILRLHEHKRDLASSLLEGTNDSHKITTAELLDMIV